MPFSRSISGQDLTMNAQQGVYKLDQFRSMVNYENTTNKGYVRFTKGSDGKLSIEKFNNVWNLPLWMRSNIKGTHNSSIRASLMKTLQPFMKYLDENEKGVMNNLVLTPYADKTKKTTDPNKVMSRLELKEIFEKFDSYFNSPVGRGKILDRLISNAMFECNYTGSVDLFKKEYLRLDEAGLNSDVIFQHTTYKPEESITEEQKQKGIKRVTDLNPKDQMAKSAEDFLVILAQVQNCIDDAKIRASMVNSCKSLATTLVENPSAFAQPAQGNAQIATIRAALTTYMSKAHLTDVDLGVQVGGGNCGLDNFIGIVLPAMIRQAVEHTFEVADVKDKASVEDALDSVLNVDTIFDTFKSFLAGAKDAVTNVSMNDAQNMANNLKSTFSQAMETYCKVDVFSVAVQSAKTIQFREQGVATKLVGDINRQLTEPLIKEVALENFAIQFVKAHYPKVEPKKSETRVDENGVPLSGGIIEKAKDTVNNIKIAAQLNWGVIGDNSENVEVKNRRLIFANSADKFIDAMEKNAVTLVNGVNGGTRLYQRLLTGPVANMLNAKIAEAKNSKDINAKVNIGEDSYDAAYDQMKAARDAWVQFCQQSEGIKMKARDAFVSHLNRLQKRGNITAEERTQLLSDYDVRIRDAVKNAVERFFFEKTPISLASNKVEDMTKVGLKSITDLFAAERSNVMADMRERISVMISANKIMLGPRKTMLDVNKAIQDLREVADMQKYLKKLKDTGVSDGDVNIAFRRLWYASLAERFANNKVKYDKDFDYDDLYKRIVSDFYDRVKKFANSYAGVVEKIDKKMNSMARAAVEHELLELPSFIKYKKELPAAELKALCESLTTDLVIARKTMLDVLKSRFFNNPDVFKKSDVNEQLIVDELFTGYGKDFASTDLNRFNVYRDITDNRINAVASWTLNPNGEKDPGKVKSLGDMMTANMKLHLEQIDVKVKNEKLVATASKIPLVERNEIVSTAIKEVLAAASKFALSYASGGKAKFLARVEREILERVEARIVAYAKFRAEFMPLADEVLKKYPAMGEEVLKSKLNSALLSQCRQPAYPKAKAFALAFDGMLKQELNTKIQMSEQDFEKYANEIAALYDKCVKVFDSQVAATKQVLLEAGATQEDLDYLDKELMPVLRSQLETEIQQRPESYARVNQGVDFGKRLAEFKADDIVDSMKNALEKIQITKMVGLRDTLYEIGFKTILVSDEAVSQAEEAVKTWIKGEGAEQLLSKARRAAMRLAVYGSSNPRVSGEVNAVLNEFKGAMRDMLLGVQTSVLQKDFQEFQVSPAATMFKSWLAQYKLPQLTIVSKDADGGTSTDTIENLVMKNFQKRVAEFQAKIVESKGEGLGDEQLLSAEYIQNLLMFINQTGLKVVIADNQSEIVKAQVKKIVEDPKNKDLFDASDVSGLPVEQLTVRQMNTVSLTNFLIHTLDDAADKLKLTTMEDLARWGKEGITDAFSQAIADAKERYDDFIEFAERRIKLMATIDEKSSNGKVDDLLRSALTAHFGNVDILDEGALKGNFVTKNYDDWTAFFNVLRVKCYMKVAEKVAVMKDMARQYLTLEDTRMDKLPVDGVKVGFYTYNLLTDALRAVVNSVVKVQEFSKDMVPSGKSKRTMAVMFADIKKAINPAARNAKPTVVAEESASYGSVLETGADMYGGSAINDSQMF